MKIRGKFQAAVRGGREESMEMILEVWGCRDGVF